MAASIGEQLRLAREERGIGLREICDQTRISVHYLEAIEANDYKRLPGGVFNRSFIKAYAKCVGYDEREAIEGYTRYLREHGENADEVNTTSDPLESLHRHSGHAFAYIDRVAGDFDSGIADSRSTGSVLLVSKASRGRRRPRARKFTLSMYNDLTSNNERLKAVLLSHKKAQKTQPTPSALLFCALVCLFVANSFT